MLAWLLPGLLGCPTPIGGHHPHLLAATATQLEFGLFLLVTCTGIDIISRDTIKTYPYGYQ